MSEAQSPFERTGIGQHLSLFATNLLAYIQARLALIGIEFRDAGKHYVKLLLLIAIASVLLLFAYLFILIAGAFALQSLCGLRWIWVTLGLGGIHLLGGILLLLWAKSIFKKPVFDATLSELKKDSVWITNQTKQNPL